MIPLQLSCIGAPRRYFLQQCIDRVVLNFPIMPVLCIALDSKWHARQYGMNTNRTKSKANVQAGAFSQGDLKWTRINWRNPEAGGGAAAAAAASAAGRKYLLQDCCRSCSMSLLISSVSALASVSVALVTVLAAMPGVCFNFSEAVADTSRTTYDIESLPFIDCGTRPIAMQSALDALTAV